MFDKKLNQSKIICLDLSSSVAYKKKKSLIDLLTTHGFKVSFVLNKSASLLARDERDNADTFKCRTAFKLGVPIVHVDYLYELLLAGNTKARIESFLIKNKKNEDDFQNGVVAVLPSN
jgi:hypothetical protein